MYGLATRKHNFFDVDPPYKTERKTFKLDLKAANKILDSNGWKVSQKDGFRYKNDKKLSLRLLYASNAHNPYLVTIKNQLQRIGIELVLSLQDGSTFFRTIDSGKYQAILVFFGGGRYPSPRQFLHTENIKTFYQQSFFVWE